VVAALALILAYTLVQFLFDLLNLLLKVLVRFLQVHRARAWLVVGLLLGMSGCGGAALVLG